MSDLGDRLAAALEVRPPTRTTQKGAREAAVLIPMVGGGEDACEDDPTLIFTVRTDTLSSHKGQISFPGGSIDPGDESPRHTALRESQEEIGIEPDAVRIVGELDTFPTYVTGYVVTPFVGWLPEEPDLRPNPAEVAEILHVPLAHLTETIRADPGFLHDGHTYPTEAWIWNDHVIWGVTARILRLLLVRLAGAGLVSEPGPDPWLHFQMP